MSTTYKFWLAYDAELATSELDACPDFTCESTCFEDALQAAVATLRDTYYVAEEGSAHDSLLCHCPQYDYWYRVTISAPNQSFVIDHGQVLTPSQAKTYFKEQP